MSWIAYLIQYTRIPQYTVQLMSDVCTCVSASDSPERVQMLGQVASAIDVMECDGHERAKGIVAPEVGCHGHASERVL